MGPPLYKWYEAVQSALDFLLDLLFWATPFVCEPCNFPVWHLLLFSPLLPVRLSRKFNVPYQVLVSTFSMAFATLFGVVFWYHISIAIALALSSICLAFLCLVDFQQHKFSLCCSQVSLYSRAFAFRSIPLPYIEALCYISLRSACWSPEFSCHSLNCLCCCRNAPFISVITFPSQQRSSISLLRIIESNRFRLGNDPQLNNYSFPSCNSLAIYYYSAELRVL